MSREPLLAAFDDLLARRPTAPLVIASGRHATVADVDALARAAAVALAAGAGTGVGAGAGSAPRPGEAVALQAANGPAFLAALVALRRAGCAVLLLDRRTPELERHRVGAEVGARFALLAVDPWNAACDPAGFRLEALGGPGHVPTASRPLPAGTAVVKLTSGSTGAARGIAATMESLVADDEALRAAMGIGTDDRLLAAVPFSHSYGLSSLVMPALTAGLPLVLPADKAPFCPIAAAAEAEATVLPTVPAYLGALCRLADPPPLPASLRLVLTAGAPLGAETSTRFRQRFGLAVHVFYGASEVGGICYDREGGAAERGTVGTPVGGVRLELAAVGDDGTDLLQGDTGDGGRLIVRSPAAALGYLPATAATAGRLAGGRFVTDDLAVWRGGELALVGRLNDLINVKGKKVNPREVETVLAALPAVEEAMVFGSPVSHPGGADRDPVVRAVIACRPGSLTTAEVVAHCRRRLADHKVPRSVVLVDELPRNDRGKLDRRAAGALAVGGDAAASSPLPAG